MSARLLTCLAALLGCYQTVDLSPPTDATVGDATVGDAWTGPDAANVCPADAPVTPLEWVATLAVAEDGCIAARLAGAQCLLRLDVPAGETLAAWCTAARGRTPTLTEPGRCDVEQIGPTGGVFTAPPAGGSGYYLTAGTGGACAFRVAVTDEATGRLRNASLRCVTRESDPTPPRAAGPPRSGRRVRSSARPGARSGDRLARSTRPSCCALGRRSAPRASACRAGRPARRRPSARACAQATRARRTARAPPGWPARAPRRSSSAAASRRRATAPPPAEPLRRWSPRRGRLRLEVST